MIADFYHLHPMWTWAALAGVLLAAEIATGTGWLLWPAACAGVVAVLALTRVLGLPGEVIVFALLSIASSLTARKYLKKSDLQPGQNGFDHDAPCSRLVPSGRASPTWITTSTPPFSRTKDTPARG